MAIWCSLSYFWLSRLKSTCWPLDGISNPLKLVCFRSMLLTNFLSSYEHSRPTFKIILPYFGYQFTSFKFSIGLTSHDFCNFYLFMSISIHPRSAQAFLVISNKKTFIFSVNCVMCYYPKCIVLQGNCQVRGRNVDINKLKSKDGVQTFFFQAFKRFHKLWFGRVCCWKMWCKFFLCWCHKHLLINLFLFGDVNNAPRPWVNSL